ncbi:MAG: hypothetical protein M1834_004547 [Cirrosporium novae-zelandiae]|nr:MAG: hypothetical protein M1834_004547 [Cirrosporium novae-zelandiae]
MSPLHHLKTLKLPQLKRLALSTGLNTTGPKPQLLSQLSLRLATPLFVTPASIISIDMGIKNLAYCHIVIPPTPPKTKKARAKTKTKEKTKIESGDVSDQQQSAPSPPQTPQLKTWTHHSFLPLPSPTTTTTTTTTTTPPLPPNEKPKKPEILPTLSHHANTLLTTLLSQTPTPTHILIEQQRWRSVGGSAIQEWTVRVNTLEAMLHAVLEALRQRGEWTGEVVSVSPGKVAGFWLTKEGEEKEKGKEKVGEGEGKGGRKTKGLGARRKREKVDLVGGWLEGGEVVLGPASGAKGTAVGYLEKWVKKGKGKGGRRVKKDAKTSGDGVDDEDTSAEADIGKLDDLADCLLQGMAWIRWEENRQKILANGYEGLDNLT